jgi:hypothetical protein
MALISVHDASESSGISAKLLAKLIRGGIVDGHRIEQTWILDTRSLKRYTQHGRVGRKTCAWPKARARQILRERLLH